MLKRFGSKRIRILAVGKPDKEAKPLIDKLVSNISNFCGIELKSIKESPKRSLPERRASESTKISKMISEGEFVVLLDEKGKKLNSEEFASMLEKALEGFKYIDFLIGSDAGLDKNIIGNVNETVSLSDMTFSHRVALIVLLEQIYRSFTILVGHPYHRK
ncbi:MAG: 23S rRNA (pseudouridine(1915)-N(3))-methyltransferase RlmH [Actinobacteria bacterium]|nr:23S rRNA (pseudouridine(1915)-N(3))-methyltransferase RlmH [Actinomycetota bacterium]